MQKVEKKIFETDNVLDFIKYIQDGYFDRVYKDPNRVKYVVLDNKIILWDILKTEIFAHDAGLKYYSDISGVGNLPHHGGGFVKFTNKAQVEFTFYETSEKLGGPDKEYFIPLYTEFRDNTREFGILVKYDERYKDLWRELEEKKKEEAAQKKKWWQIF